MVEMKNKFSNLEEKLYQIDIREAFRALEHYIILECVGSKNKMVKDKINTIEDLVKIPDFNKKFDAFEKDNLSKEEKNAILVLIPYFKNSGDVVIHNDEIKSKKEELVDCLLQEAEDMDGLYSEVLPKMMNLLEIFCQKFQKPFGRGPKYKEMKRMNLK